MTKRNEQIEAIRLREEKTPECTNPTSMLMLEHGPDQDRGCR
jgi:hypothetical protein